MRRKAYEQLKVWKESPGSHALLVTGARQVGKTYLVEQFCRENYRNVVELNLIDDLQAREALSQATGPDDLFMRITAFADAPIVPGETVVFIDEVQESKEVVTAVKGLVRRGGCDYILSGSLLGVELRDIRSWPVGYLFTCEMFPLDFEEFLWATGRPDHLLQAARECMDAEREVPTYVHDLLLQAFYEYLVVGGMPEAVDAYVRTGDVQQAHAVLTQVSNLYRADITRYAGAQARTVRRAFDLIPAELSKQNKRFVIKSVEGVPRAERYENDFLWIADAGVGLPCYNTTEPRAPLLLNMEDRRFKLYMGDVGMLCNQCGMGVVRSLVAERRDLNYGAVYENAVAQELRAAGSRLFYFTKRGVGELDFLVEDDGMRVVPIEVKSGKTYKRHNALRHALSTENYGIERAFVLCDGNVEREKRVLYLPIYLAGTLIQRLLGKTTSQ